jgi:hypothetical protein
LTHAVWAKVSISVANAVKDHAGHFVDGTTMLGPSFRYLKKRVEKKIIPPLIERAVLA